jgi:cell division protein FtsI/penicillin-binding protein 2
VSLEENFKRQADARGALAKTRQRLSFAMTAFSLVFVLLFGRLIEVSVLREPAGAKVARVESDTSYYRADIVDRKGEILATDLQGASLYADARVVWDPAEAARDLQKVLPGLNVETVTRKLSTRQALSGSSGTSALASRKPSASLVFPGFRSSRSRAGSIPMAEPPHTSWAMSASTITVWPVWSVALKIL